MRTDASESKYPEYTQFPTRNFKSHKQHSQTFVVQISQTVIYPVVHPSIVKITSRTIHLSYSWIRIFSQIKYNRAQKAGKKRGNEQNRGDIIRFPLWEIRELKIKKDEKRGKLKRKKKTSRSRPPSALPPPIPFQSFKASCRAKDVFRGKRDGKRRVLRSGHRVYANTEHTRRFHGKLSYLDEPRGVRARLISDFVFGLFIVRRWRKRGRREKRKKRGKEERKKGKKAIVSFLWSVCKSGMEKSCISDERSWSDISCPLLKLGRDSDLGFDENRKTRWRYGYREAFFFSFSLFRRFRFEGLEIFC